MRDALLYIPAAADPAGPIPLAVSLHGAGGNAQHGLDLLKDRADAHRFAVLAPASAAGTWDVIVSGYGPDVKAIDGLLAQTFRRVPVRRNAVSISGFSDGASYALSLGLANALFQHILAFSPGFMMPPREEDKPQVFISHGIRDTVLPIDPCSRSIVPRLRRAGYRVEYREFDGPHVVPADIKEDAIQWWYGSFKGE